MTSDEWEKRQLCSDGNCIGVIGPDGRCKECGKPGEMEVPPAELASEDPEASGAEAYDDSEAPDGTGDAEEPEATDDDDWENRRLCPDGNCIGVIGPDGRCKECGRSEE
jgi:hypothetical protein